VTVSTSREQLDRLYPELEGLEGAEVASLRGLLRRLPLDVPLPSDLALRVEQARQDAIHEQNRRFALQITREVLEEQGFPLGKDFVTVIASADGVVLPLAASRRHGVRVRERAGQLLLNVVRFERPSVGGDDVESPSAFCESFETIVHRAGANGLSMTRVVHVEPGSGYVDVRSEESSFERTDEVPKDPQQGERRRT